MPEYVCEVVTEHELCGDVHHYVRHERVVRCRDCVHWRRPNGRERSRCTGAMAFVEPTQDGFCAWGREREG